MPLVLAWNFSEASGDVLDLSGNSRGFALGANTVRTAAGGGYTYGGTVPNNKGLTQSAAAIQVGPAITGLNTTNRTLAMWVKLGTAFTGWTIEYHRTAEDTGVFGFLYLSSVFRARAKNSSNTVFESSTITPDAGNWHFLAMTHDGATLRTYRDGVELGSGTAMAFPVWTADDLRVLDQSGSQATISDVRIYDEILDATALTALMAVPVTAGGSTVNGTASVSAGATITATGKRTVKGSVTVSAGLSATAAGKRTVKGAAAVSAALTASASGRRTVHGAAQVSSALVITATSPPPVTGIPGRLSGPSGDLTGSIARETIDLPGTIR